MKHGAPLKWFSWATWNTVFNSKYLVGKHKTRCPTQKIQLGNLKHGAQLKIFSLATWNVEPNSKYSVGQHEMRSPTQNIQLGNMKCCAQLQIFSWATWNTVPNSKYLVGQHETLFRWPLYSALKAWHTLRTRIQAEKGVPTQKAKIKCFKTFFFLSGKKVV